MLSLLGIYAQVIVMSYASYKKSIVVKILHESVTSAFQEAAVAIDSVANNGIGLFVDYNRTRPSFVLVDIKDAKHEIASIGPSIEADDESYPDVDDLVDSITGKIRIVGAIGLEKHDDCMFYSVAYVVAAKGYGPVLYDIAMTYVTQEHFALTSDREIVRPQARNIWRKYLQRNDVKKHPIEAPECLSATQTNDATEKRLFSTAFSAGNLVNTDALENTWEAFRDSVHTEVRIRADQDYYQSFKNAFKRAILQKASEAFGGAFHSGKQLSP